MQSSTTTIAAGHSAAKTPKTTAATPATTPAGAPKAPKPVKAPKKESFRRGLKKSEAIEIVEKFKFPTTPFTLHQIFEATGICHWYLVDYVKKNAKIVGEAPKRPGVRGKQPQLYQLSK